MCRKEGVYIERKACRILSLQAWDWLPYMEGNSKPEGNSQQSVTTWKSFQDSKASVICPLCLLRDWLVLWQGKGGSDSGAKVHFLFRFFSRFYSNFWDQAKYLWHALNLRAECFLLVLVSWSGDFSLVLGPKCLFPDSGLLFSECVSFPGSDCRARLFGVVLGLWTH